MGLSILAASGVMAFIIRRFYRRGRFGAEVMLDIVDFISVYGEAGPAYALKVKFTVPGRGVTITESRAYLNAALDEFGYMRGGYGLARYSAHNPAKV